jgi:uncharacterized membrane protein YccC
MQEVNSRASFSPWEVVDAVRMSLACLITYWIITHGLSRFVERDSDLLAGMWAVIATIFVFRATRADTLSAGLARLIATCVSFALCLPYLWLFPFTIGGLAALLGVGTVVMTLLGRREDIITTAITTTVVMVVAAISPLEAWHQPLLRLVDTVVGIGVGVSFRWITLFPQEGAR